MLLSLPDTWNYSVRGLSSITPDGVDGVLTALKELERLGYLERNQQRESNGRMGRAEYVIYLAKTAFSLFAKNYQWEHPIRSVTVRAINLFEEDCPIQYDLFTDVKSLDRQERLDAAIEQIRFRFGKDAIKNGVLFQKSKMPTERKVDLVMPTGMIG